MISSLFYHNNTISLKVESSKLFVVFEDFGMDSNQASKEDATWVIILLESRTWDHTLRSFSSLSLTCYVLYWWCELSSMNRLVSQDLVWFVFNIRDVGWLYIRIEFLIFCSIAVWKMSHLNSFCYYLLIKCISQHSLMFLW